MAQERSGGEGSKASRLSTVDTRQVDNMQKRGAHTPQELNQMTDPGQMMKRIVELSMKGEHEQMDALYEEYQRRFMQGEDANREPVRTPRLIQPSNRGSMQ